LQERRERVVVLLKGDLCASSCWSASATICSCWSRCAAASDPIVAQCRLLQAPGVVLPPQREPRRQGAETWAGHLAGADRTLRSNPFGSNPFGSKVPLWSLDRTLPLWIRDELLDQFLPRIGDALFLRVENELLHVLSWW